MPAFTHDWFSHNVPTLREVLGKLSQRRHFLEIGCFEGLSTCWFLVHALEETGEICCVDPFTGSEEHGEVDYRDLRNRFQANVDEMKRPAQVVSVFQESSRGALPRFVAEGRSFDFIYVDGSHVAADVLRDACFAFELAKVGGIVVFDDYMWSTKKRGLLHAPKLAVDAFTAVYDERLEIVSIGYQLAIRRLA